MNDLRSSSSNTALFEDEGFRCAAGAACGIPGWGSLLVGRQLVGPGGQPNCFRSLTSSKQAWLPPQTKNSRSQSDQLPSLLAEDEGFEPPDPCGSTVFKTAAIDHSANPPKYATPKRGPNSLVFLREELPLEQEQVNRSYRDAAVREVKYRLKEDVTSH